MEVYFFHSSGRLEVQYQSTIIEASLGSQMAAFLLCLHMAYSLCTYPEHSVVSSFMGTSPIGLGPYLYNLIYF